MDAERRRAQQIALECKSPEMMDLASERIGHLLRRRHRLQPPFPDNDDFTIRSQASARSGKIFTVQFIGSIVAWARNGVL